MKYELSFAVAFLIVSGVQAEDTGVNFTLAPSVVSECVSSHGYLLHDGVALQTDAKIIFPGGLTAGVWWSTGLNGRGLSSDKADELDPYIGFAKKGIKWQIDTRLAYFNFVELSQVRGDLLVSSVEIGREFKEGKQTFVPFVRIENRQRLPSFDFNRWMPVMGLRHEWAIGKRVSFSQRVGLLYDSGTPMADDGLLVQYRAGIKWQLSKRAGLEPFVRFSWPLTIHDARRTQTIGGVTIIFNAR